MDNERRCDALAPRRQRRIVQMGQKQPKARRQIDAYIVDWLIAEHPS